MMRPPATIPLFATAHPPELSAALREAFARVEASGRYVLGEEVERFEELLARHLGVRWVVGVSSGTDALLCSLLALGIGPGDEVLTTPFSFVATAEAIARTGATPVFVEVRPDTLALDLDSVEAALTPRTRAIVPVHLYGLPADLPRLMTLTQGHGLALVEDAAQALGASVDGRPVGAWGDLAALSFFPSKPLGGLGDGGAIATDDAELAARCRSLRSHGRAGSASQREGYLQLGGNFRLDALQAALLAEKLPYLEPWRAERERLAAAYDAALLDLGDAGRLRRVGAACAAQPAGAPALRGAGPPSRDREARSAHALYTVRVPGGGRDALLRGLAKAGIESRAHYPRPLYREPCFSGRCRIGAGERQALPQAERAASEVLSLPLFAGLKPRQQERVSAELRRLLR